MLFFADVARRVLGAAESSRAASSWIMNAASKVFAFGLRASNLPRST